MLVCDSYTESVHHAAVKTFQRESRYLFCLHWSSADRECSVYLLKRTGTFLTVQEPVGMGRVRSQLHSMQLNES